MKTKFWMMTMAAGMMMALSACSSSEDSSEIDPTKPQTPINDDDWETISSSGGTIEKDDITITFPSGTFNSDTKVAITKVTKGKIGKKFETSGFYQLALPSTIGAPITFSVKSEKAGNNVFIVHSTGFCLSSLKNATSDEELETTYSNGCYTATLPKYDNGDDPENIYITVGMINPPTLNQSNTRGTRGVLWGGRVKNITWQIKTPIETWWEYDNSTLSKLESYSSTLNGYIENALKKIFNLGFEISGERFVYVYYMPGENWGGFTQNGRSDYASWIELGAEKLLDPNTTQTEVQQTVIHEFLHYFQSGYDPRKPKVKAKAENNTEGLTFSEMASVWIEHFMNSGQLNASFLSKEFEHPLLADALTLADIPEAWFPNNNDINSKLKAYQGQGYCLGPLLYYLTSQAKENGFTLQDKSVVELHQIWGNNIHSSLLDWLDTWLFSKNNFGFLIGSMIDDYYLKLFQGKVVNDFDISVYTRKDKSLNSGGTDLINKNIYPYGCSIAKALLEQGKTYENKELVMKQLTKGMHTYLISRNDKDYSIQLLTKVAVAPGDSIVISGETLEKMSKNNTVSFFLLTTHIENSVLDHGKKPYTVSIDIRDAKKEEIPDKVKSLTIWFDVYSNNHADAARPREHNKKIKFEAGDLKVSKSGKTLNITGKMSGAYNNIDTNITTSLSLKVNYGSSSWSDMTDVSITSTLTNSKWKWTDKYEVEASNLTLGGLEYGYGYRWETKGDNITKFVYTHKESGNDFTENIRKEENSFNFVKIYIDFDK